MDTSEWIYQIIVEGMKYIIIAHWFLGFTFSQKKTKYFLLIYPVVVPVVQYLDIPHTVFLYCYSWGLLLLVAVFEGKMTEKVKAFFIIWFLIALVDALIVMVYIMFFDLLIINGSVWLGTVIGCIGAMFWGFMALKSNKIKQYTKSFWKKLSNKEFALLFLVLGTLSLLVGDIQSNLDNTTTISMKAITFMSVLLAVCIFVILLIVFLYTKWSKKQLEEVNRLNVRYLEFQKKYYTESLKQYEDMRRFRHDINHHLRILLELSREDKVAEIKGYIGTMAESYEKMRGIHSGNFIADCIISHTLYKLKGKEAFTFDMEGHFPETFFMEDIDFCILLSNLLENAREALEKITGECMLQIEVKHFRQWFYLIVQNSTDKDTIDFQETSKQDKRNHGYGVRNISRIAEKYNGTVLWNCENGIAEVKLKFNVERLK